MRQDNIKKHEGFRVLAKIIARVVYEKKFNKKRGE